MELIRPTEVSAKILSLIEDATKSLIIVSPYNAFINKDNIEWKKLIKQFQKAQSKGVNISYYARRGEHHKGLESLNISPILIESLHAKLYINDTYAILSSMNLVYASDEQSIDFAVKTETIKEYNDVLDYFNNFIKPNYVKQIKKIDLSEIPVVEFFNSQVFFKNSQFDLVKTYYDNTSFIKELGFKKDNNKAGSWFYFSEQGLLIKSESFFDEHKSYEIDYKGKIGKYDIIFTLANIIGGLFQCSLQQLYFKSKISFFTSNNNEVLYSHIEKVLSIEPIRRDCISMEDLVDEVHYHLRKKPTFIINT